MDERDLTWWTHDIWTFILKWGVPGCTHFTPWKPLKLEASGISKSGSEGGLRTRPDPLPTPMLLVMAPQSWPNKGLLYSWGHRPTWGQRCCPQNRIQKKSISLTVGPTEPILTQLSDCLQGDLDPQAGHQRKKRSTHTDRWGSHERPSKIPLQWSPPVTRLPIRRKLPITF